MIAICVGLFATVVGFFLARTIAAPVKTLTRCVEQASHAMISIEETERENFDRTRQLEDAARQIRVLGESLKELAERFRI